MTIDIWLNALAIILFLGFAMAAFIAFSTIDKQKDITIPSRYGRQTGSLEIVYVNLAMLGVAAMLYWKNVRFLPALLAFIILILLNGRMQSGIAPQGVFIETVFLEWNRIRAYRIVNDAISSVEVRVYAGKKQYALRCDKKFRAEIEAYFSEHQIPQYRQPESGN